MSAPYQFSITKTRMIQLGVCLGAIQVLLYTSGVATGLLIGPKMSTSGEVLRARAEARFTRVEDRFKGGAKKQTAVTPAATKTQPEAGGATLAAAAPASPPPAHTIASHAAVTEPAAPASTAPPATTAQAEPAQAAQSTPAETSPSEAGAEPSVAVQVASFHTRSNAVRLADLLKKQGYGPVLVGESSSDGVDTWHFVQLGPYKAWEEASRIVAELDRSYEVHAYVRPLRGAVN